jgi:hypothetical protein
VFAWRKSGEVRFAEVKIGSDRVRKSQREFLETALRCGRSRSEFLIIEAVLVPAAG